MLQPHLSTEESVELLVLFSEFLASEESSAVLQESADSVDSEVAAEDEEQVRDGD